jgi:protein-L-isoaspartate O-methyltransferase
MRNAMVESQLRTSDVNDPRVIAAMASVPRESFVPEARRAMAYIDRPVRLSGDRADSMRRSDRALRSTWSKRRPSSTRSASRCAGATPSPLQR